MLEYMLVRNADVPILEKSKGKLRWILLDEAHTLTGSKAAEMALLIRRVADAFGVDVNDLRFAITSATVGSGDGNKLRKFMLEVLPEYDRDRVYPSDIRKLINWYNILINSGFTSFVEAESVEETEASRCRILKNL